jgi:DNA-directed RNA polymerase specialized sigma24 family protein
LDEELLVTGDRPLDVAALDDALQVLEKIDARRSQVIELRFFGGLTVDERAIVLKVAPGYCDARHAIGEGMVGARADWRDTT